jgi:uncharacterized membrane protein
MPLTSKVARVAPLLPLSHLPLAVTPRQRPQLHPAQATRLLPLLLQQLPPVAGLLAPAIDPVCPFTLSTTMPLKKYLLAGLLVWTPLAITVWVLTWLVGVMDGMFINTVSSVVSHDTLVELRDITGLGVVLVFLGLLITGALVSNVAGRWWVKQWDKLFTHIPIVKSIYTSVKKVSDTLFSSNGNAFRQALLVQYPRAGVWTIAFQTGTPSGEIADKLPGDYVSVYVPTTPNPTSGFFLVVPRSEVKELDLSVDEALTYVISMGAVSPGTPSIQTKSN